MSIKVNSILQTSIYFLLSMIAIVLTLFIFYMIILKNQFDLDYYFVIMIFGVIASTLLIIYTLEFKRRFTPASYNVAIVGFPSSGKTTLIISVFAEAFAGRILSVRLNPRGQNSIERINESLEMLESGKSLGPTKDQDRFAFRAELSYRKFLIPGKLKVEFGDFPGENSKEYTENYGTWLHTTEYFKWVVESDAIIFIVDLGYYLAGEDKKNAYIARMSSALRAAWQNYLDVNDYRRNTVIKHPVRLVFNKADLFGVIDQELKWDAIEEKILEIGFGPKSPNIKELDIESFFHWKEIVINDFNDLIQYFQKESLNFKVQFTSSFGTLKKARFGISELLYNLLPFGIKGEKQIDSKVSTDSPFVDLLSSMIQANNKLKRK